MQPDPCRIPLMPSTSRNGKICYIEMPATDVAQSSEFYARVFGWQL
jgi:predicted enzyme related to lactoylglutathione lyase